MTKKQKTKKLKFQSTILCNAKSVIRWRPKLISQQCSFLVQKYVTCGDALKRWSFTHVVRRVVRVDPAPCCMPGPRHQDRLLMWIYHVTRCLTLYCSSSFQEKNRSSLSYPLMDRGTCFICCWFLLPCTSEAKVIHGYWILVKCQYPAGLYGCQCWYKTPVLSFSVYLRNLNPCVCYAKLFLCLSWQTEGKLNRPKVDPYTSSNFVDLSCV